jgi:hypothetical protein
MSIDEYDDTPTPEELEERAASRQQDIWLSRDRLDGRLSERVDVWGVRPQASRYDDGDVLWYAMVEAGQTALLARWTLGRAHQVAGTVPDDERQVILVGSTPPVVRG